MKGESTTKLQLLSYAFLIIGICVFTIPVSGWIIETVDETGNVGQYTSIAVDYAGNPHIGYYDVTNGNLKYAKRDAWGTWTIETVDSSAYYNVGQYSSIALDNYNIPHISYFDASTNSLKYATKSGGTWTTLTLQHGMPSGQNIVGQYSSIAINSKNIPHISSYAKVDTTHYLQIGMVQGQNFPFQIVTSDGQPIKYTSLAFDITDIPYISYQYRDTNLRYASNPGTGWTSQTVDGSPGSGAWSSIAVDEGGHIHISHHPTGYLKYAYAGHYNQVVESTGTAGVGTSIAVDQFNNPSIAYYHSNSGDLKYTKGPGAPWEIETVDEAGDVGRYPSLAIDSSGIAHISYYDATNGDLKYAKWSMMDTLSVPETIDFNNFSVGNNTITDLGLSYSTNDPSASSVTITVHGKWETHDPSPWMWHEDDPEEHLTNPLNIWSYENESYVSLTDTGDVAIILDFPSWGEWSVDDWMVNQLIDPSDSPGDYRLILVFTGTAGQI